jgi:hypothetical protein
MSTAASSGILLLMLLAGILDAVPYLAGPLSVVDTSAAQFAVALAAERARLAVTKRIKAALTKIRAANPALARHLSGAITTGYFCSYTPKADPPTSWSC